MGSVTTPSVPKRVYKLCETIRAAELELERRFKGKTMIVPRGKYAGRRGVCDGVCLYGDLEWEPCFLVRPYNLHTGEPMNDDPDSRTYWRLRDFTPTHPSGGSDEKHQD